MRRILFVSVLVAAMASLGLNAALAGRIGSVSFREKTLKNGLKVFVAQEKEVPLFSFYLLIPAGSAMDEPGKEGVANLTAELLLKGAAGMSANELAEAIEGLGGRIYTNAGRDYTAISGDFLSVDLEQGLGLLAKIVLKPDFPQEEVQREKSIIISEINSLRENPSQLADREIINYIAEGHPYAHPVEGYARSVEGIARGEVEAFYKKHYVPKGAILAVVGDVSSSKVFKLVSKKFSSWRGSAGSEGVVQAIEPAKPIERRVIVIDKPDATQSQIRIANIAAPMNTSDYFPLEVANNILGGGFTSRLMDEIRVNRGLTYGARSRLLQYKYGGFFGVVTFTKNKTLRETVDVALAELKKMREKGVTEDELEKSKRYLAGLFPLNLETHGDIARLLATTEFYGLPLSYVNDYRKLVNGVTADDVKKVAERYFAADDNIILLITNYSETRDQLEGLGPLKVVPIDSLE